MTTKRALLALLLLLLAVVPTLAQDAASPLILVKNGDLWEWTGGPTLRQKTQWGYNSGLTLSPRLDEIAYNSLPTAVVEYITQEGGVGGGSLPTNIWVITTQATDAAYRPADQPADASFMVPGVPEKGLVRSGAMWSPDATQIAWVETGFAQDGTGRLIIYDKASQTTRTVLTGLPPQYGEGAGLYGEWLYEGIVLYSYTYNEATASPENSLIVIDPDLGQIRFTIPLTGGSNLMIALKMPVVYQEHSAIGVLLAGETASSQWYAANLETGTLEAVFSSIPTGQPALEGPGGLIQAVPRVLHSETMGFGVDYGFYQPDGTPIILNSDPAKYIHRFAFSPDGQAIAYQIASMVDYEYDHTIYIWRNGNITSVPETANALNGIYEFVWGRTWWTFPE